MDSAVTIHLVYSQKSNNMDIFIQSAAQISIQNPLCEDWFENPIFYNQSYNRSLEPDYKPFINPIAARRMGKLIKRAIATSLLAKQKACIHDFDAIITGTGLGCIENTEKFLSAMVNDGEQFLQPTYFMQSTHNTISSQIALNQKCNGYNCTYSHRGTSFECALSDAFLQLSLGKIQNALVGAHDEMTPDYFNMLGKIGCWKDGEINENILKQSNSKGSFAGETSVSIVLGTQKQDNSLCKLLDVEMLYKPTDAKMQQVLLSLLNNSNLQNTDVDVVFVGLSGDEKWDRVYMQFIQTYFPTSAVAWYKHIFGESFTSPSFGMYVGAECIAKGFIPSFMNYKENKRIEIPQNVLIYNHFQNINHSLILLRKL